MLLFYIDESGTGLEDKQTPFFVIAAVAIPAEQWQWVDSQTTALKRRLVSWARPEDFEIKGRDLRRGEKLFKNLDMHSSVQDRRLVDVYREWTGSRMGHTQLVELPWFGFSAFYAGLQLADFAAYLVDFVSNETENRRGSLELQAAFARFQSKVQSVRIPRKKLAHEHVRGPALTYW